MAGMCHSPLSHHPGSKICCQLCCGAPLEQCYAALLWHLELRSREGWWQEYLTVVSVVASSSVSSPILLSARDGQWDSAVRS